MIKADISHFSGKYSHLNSVSKNLNISLLDLAKSVVTVGHLNWNNTLSMGFYKIGELILKTLAHVETKNNFLQLTNLFWNLEKTEKMTVSYQLGMGLTKAVTEKLLNIPWLIHLGHYHGNVEYRRTGHNLSKLILYHSRNYFRKPDLIGFDSEALPHVFEAKGLSTQYDKGAIQDAIDQVSQVHSINGIRPETRVACCFNLSSHPITAQIVDPNEKLRKGIKFEINITEMFNNYYSMFLFDDSWVETKIIQLFDRKFKIRAIGAPNIYIGIDNEIYNMVKESSFLNQYPKWYKNNKIFILEMQNNMNYSFGLDGILLMNGKY